MWNVAYEDDRAENSSESRGDDWIGQLISKPVYLWKLMRAATLVTKRDSHIYNQAIGFSPMPCRTDYLLLTFTYAQTVSFWLC
jgi:hypothetical protein